MSSLRNAVQRRNHKERAQPTERANWGLLEKHKDYSLRAADHNAKKRKLRALQAKAADRNEDEFYYGMMSSSTMGGIKRAKRGEDNSGGSGEKSLGVEVVKLMKTQDVGYLRTVLQSTRRERERLESDVIVAEKGVDLSAPSVTSGTKTVFGENGEDAVVTSSAVDDDLDDLVGLDGEEEDDGMESEGDDTSLTPAELAVKQRKRHNLAVKRRKLEGLRDREDQLSTALLALEDQRARMNGAVGGVNKSGTKFKTRQRKK